MDTCPRKPGSNHHRHRRYLASAAVGRRLLPALSAIAALGFAMLTAPAAQAEEILEISITTPEGQFEAQHALGPVFDHYTSGPLLHESEGNRRIYTAIRCDGPWGAMRYDVALISGPGFTLRASESRLLLQILEHRVLSENRNIDAMKIHCRDSEPKTIQNSVAEIELKRGEKASRDIPLNNGYLLSFRYRP